MLRRWLALSALALVSCDSPQLVSFNTPEVCAPRVTGLSTLTQAEKSCGADCVLCVESEIDGQAWTYTVSHQDNCVCPPPRKETRPDAGSGATAGDAAAPTPNLPDSGAIDDAPVAGSDGCHSRLHLTKAQARTQCSEWEDCHVCVERVDYEGDARAYMAHQCGCPDPFRVDPD
jgi:hypothetical protein